jgi:hypothetical protein
MSAEKYLFIIVEGSLLNEALEIYGEATLLRKPFPLISLFNSLKRIFSQHVMYDMTNPRCLIFDTIFQAVFGVKTMDMAWLVEAVRSHVIVCSSVFECEVSDFGVSSSSLRVQEMRWNYFQRLLRPASEDSVSLINIDSNIPCHIVSDEFRRLISEVECYISPDKRLYSVKECVLVVACLFQHLDDKMTFHGSDGHFSVILPNQTWQSALGVNTLCSGQLWDIITNKVIVGTISPVP